MTDLCRVIVQLRSAAPNAVALEAAVDIARVLKADLESLVVEDSDVVSLACLPCAREVTFTGRPSLGLTLDRVEQDMRAATAAIRRQMERMAGVAKIPLHFGVVREEAETAIRARACEGTLLALADTLTPAEGARLQRILERMSELNGVVLAGPHARRQAGPIAVIAEDAAQLASLLAMAGRLLSPIRKRIVLLLAGVSGAGRHELVREAEIAVSALGSTAPVEMRTVLADDSILADVLRRTGSSFLVAALGGMLTPQRDHLVRLARSVDCPVMLLR